MFLAFLKKFLNATNIMAICIIGTMTFWLDIENAFEGRTWQRLYNEKLRSLDVNIYEAGSLEEYASRQKELKFYRDELSYESPLFRWVERTRYAEWGALIFLGWVLLRRMLSGIPGVGGRRGGGQVGSNPNG